MTAPSPAAELRAAAKKVREDLGAATPDRFLALLSPAVAEPLAAWLDYAAMLSDHAVENGGPGDLPGLVPALALARVLLGGAS